MGRHKINPLFSISVAEMFPVVRQETRRAMGSVIKADSARKRRDSSKKTHQDVIPDTTYRFSEARQEIVRRWSTMM